MTTINIESRKVTRQQPAKPHKQRACLYLEKRLRVSHEKAARTASSVARSSGFGFITLLIKSRRSSCTPADSASRTEGTQMLASQSTGRSSIDLVTSRTCPEWLARVKDDTLRSQKVKTRTAGAVHGPYSAVARDLRQPIKSRGTPTYPQPPRNLFYPTLVQGESKIHLAVCREVFEKPGSIPFDYLQQRIQSPRLIPAIKEPSKTSLPSRLIAARILCK